MLRWIAAIAVWNVLLPCSCAVQCPPTQLSGDLLPLLTGIRARMALANTELFVVPTPATRDAFATTVTGVLSHVHTDPSAAETAACALPPSYRYVALSDAQAQGTVACVAEVLANGTALPSLYWGTYCATLQPRRNALVSVPHP